MQLHMRTRTQLLADVRAKLRDPAGGSQRWSDAEIVGALNDALLSWRGRVSLPVIYSLSGLTSGTYSYTLPAWADADSVQLQIWRNYNDNGVPYQGEDSWVDAAGYNIEQGVDGLTMRMTMHPPSADARLFIWVSNGMLPTGTNPTLNAGITAADTSLVLGSAVADVGEAGFLKVESEYIFYGGVTRGSATTTLSNLTRGLYGSTAATHNSAVSVDWAVAAPQPSLYRQLMDKTSSYLHGLFIQVAAPTSRDMHEKMLSYFEDQAERYWRSYTPMRKPKLVLGREVLR